MGKAPSHKKTYRTAKKPEKITKCEKQFSDCPSEPNSVDCKICPLFKKKS